MLTNYYTALHAERLRASPAGTLLDDFAAWLAGRRYQPTIVRPLIRAAHCFAEWASTEGRPPVDAAAGDAYLLHLEASGRYRYRDGTRTTFARGTVLFLAFLDETDALVRATPKLDAEPSPLMAAYRAWVSGHRGIKASTFEVYRPVIKRLLACLGDQPESYRAGDIRDFVLELASQHGVSKAQTTATAVRSFLRYLAATGRCAADLVHAVPPVAARKLSSLPRYIGTDDVAQLLASCELSKPIGLRDRAVLLLLARLAMRAGDVSGLQFADIDWLHGRIRVSGKSRREVWLPLPQDVGEALAAWVTDGRPSLASDQVFTKVVAPLAPMTRWHVSQTVRRAIDRTGIQAPSQGAHMLRHTAATAMLAEGATLDEIGSVLRHVSIETTYQYAKVDAALLRMVAAPWPKLGDAPGPDARVSPAETRAIAMAWPEVAPC